MSLIVSYLFNYYYNKRNGKDWNCCHGWNWLHEGYQRVRFWVTCASAGTTAVAAVAVGDVSGYYALSAVGSSAISAQQSSITGTRDSFTVW